MTAASWIVLALAVMGVLAGVIGIALAHENEHLRSELSHYRKAKR